MNDYLFQFPFELFLQNFSYNKPTQLYSQEAVLSIKCVECRVILRPYIVCNASLLQADLEEAKSQENAKLQAALQEVQQQYKETKEILVQEREAAKKAAEIAPVIKEVPVVDTELMNKLRDENDKLKVREL